jgi:hypothetical protein
MNIPLLVLLVSAFRLDRAGCGEGSSFSWHGEYKQRKPWDFRCGKCGWRRGLVYRVLSRRDVGWYGR